MHIEERRLIHYTTFSFKNLLFGWATKGTFFECIANFQQEGRYSYWNRYYELMPIEKGVLMITIDDHQRVLEQNFKTPATL